MEPHVLACLQAGVVVNPSAVIWEVGDGLDDSGDAESLEYEGFEECLVEYGG